jgi:hypothetical protein
MLSFLIFASATMWFAAPVAAAAGPDVDDAAMMTIHSLAPRRVGLHGGARLVIRGEGLPFFPGRAPPIDLVLVGGAPCLYLKGRSHPHGRFMTCILPPMDAPGLFKVKVNGIGSESYCEAHCSVEYRHDLIPEAWVTAPDSSSSSAAAYSGSPAALSVAAVAGRAGREFSAGDHLPLLLTGASLNLHVKSLEQFTVLVGGVAVPLKSFAFGDDLDMGDGDSFLSRKVEGAYHAAAAAASHHQGLPPPPPRLMLSLPLPLDIPSGEHELSVVIDRAGPDEETAHGQVAFTDGATGKRSLFLTLKISPVITAVSHARVGSGGGNKIILDGGGFSNLHHENKVVLAGRPCEVFRASPMRLRCVLGESGSDNNNDDDNDDNEDEERDRLLAASVSPLSDRRQRGMSLHLWHLATDGIDAAGACLEEAATAFQANIEKDDDDDDEEEDSALLGILAVCLANADPEGSASDGPADGFNLPTGLHWPSLDLPRSLDHGPGIWLTPPKKDRGSSSSSSSSSKKKKEEEDTFVGAGAALFHPPVSGWFTFHLESGGLPALFVLGSEVVLNKAAEKNNKNGGGKAAAQRATVWLSAEKEYLSFFAVAVDEQGRQAKVSVDFRAATAKQQPPVAMTPNNSPPKQQQGTNKKEEEKPTTAATSSSGGGEELVASSSFSLGVVSLDAVPSSWFTGLTLHHPGHGIDRHLERAGHGRRRRRRLWGAALSSFLSLPSPPLVSLVVGGGTPALCRGTAPGACSFAVDPLLTPLVSSVEFFDAHSGASLGSDARLAFGRQQVSPPHPRKTESGEDEQQEHVQRSRRSLSVRVVVRGEGLHASREAVSLNTELPPRAWEREERTEAAWASFDPPSLFARSAAVGGSGDDSGALMCRGEHPAGATEFACTVNFQTCPEEETEEVVQSEEGGHRLLGVHLSGGGWAKLASSLEIPWPLPCAPSFVEKEEGGGDGETNKEYSLSSERESPEVPGRALYDTLFDVSDNVGVRLWSEYLETYFGGISNASDVTVSVGETLVIDADMDCQYLVVEGALRWNTSIGGLVMRAAGIMVLNNGSFELGTQQNPMLLDATIGIKSLNDTLEFTISEDDYTVVDDFDSEFDDFVDAPTNEIIDQYADIKHVVGLR